ncbi:MAG: 6-phosphogluconolactonase [Chloroflexota bacterium]|nr:6-phosphogluconolactonase [Dehalococcoidia bacterium]MDW8255300.1 6-phosphogluconolactonase [Chloroflexota bacterium]
MSLARRGTIVVVKTPAELASAAAQRIAHLAHAAVDAMGVFRIALAGGSTPRATYEGLVCEPFRSQIDWSKVEVFWSDERAVPPDHPASNYRMAVETLLAHVPIPPHSVYRMPADQTDLAAAAAAYEATLRHVFGTPAGIPVFDVILLGLGEDGHTASLFPRSRQLRSGDRLVVDGDPPSPGTAGSSPDVRRLTFTPRLINAARERIFLVAGKSKAAAVRNVLCGPWQPDLWPAQLIYGGATLPLWLLDEEAAALLPQDR